jgi:antitoxin (DNA-binding transcriptional repressor) of toxin-antitoxin stability system
MLHVKVDQLEAELEGLLRKVKAGESVTIYDGETPIARIEPTAQQAEEPMPTFASEDERLAWLIAQGIVLPPRNPNADLSILKEPPPKVRASVLEALLEERREGR